MTDKDCCLLLLLVNTSYGEVMFTVKQAAMERLKAEELAVSICLGNEAQMLMRMRILTMLAAINHGCLRNRHLHPYEREVTYSMLLRRFSVMVDLR